MKKALSIIGVVLLIIIILFVANKGLNKTPINNQQIVLGAVVSLTGYAAVDGMNIKNGMDMAVTDLKKEGVDVKIIYEDDATDPKQTVSAVNKLLAVEKPDALVGPIWSFLIDAALPVINQNKIVTFVPSSSSEVVNGTSSYIFYGTYKNIEEAGPVATFLKDNKVKTVAVIVSNDAWGNSSEVAFSKAAEMAGAKVVMLDKISFGSDKDVMPTIVAKLIKLNPDAVLWTAYDEGSTIFAKKLQEQNYNKPMIAAASIMRGLINRGVITPQAKDRWYSINVSMDPAFRAKYIATYKQEPGISADSAYDGVKILVKGIQAGKTGIELSNYLRDGFTYKGYLGTYDFDSKGDIVGGLWTIDRLIKQ